MINEKIKADLEDRGRYSLAAERKILGFLAAEPQGLHTLRDICAKKNGAHSGSFWAAAYHLAAQGKIGYAGRKYHQFSGDLASLDLFSLSICLSFLLLLVYMIRNTLHRFRVRTKARSTEGVMLARNMTLTNHSGSRKDPIPLVVEANERLKIT